MNHSFEEPVFQEKLENPQIPTDLKKAYSDAKIIFLKWIKDARNRLAKTPYDELERKDRVFLRHMLIGVNHHIQALAENILRYFPKTQDGTIPPREIHTSRGIIRLHGIVHPKGEPFLPIDTPRLMRDNLYIKACGERFSDRQTFPILIEQNLIGLFPTLAKRATLMLDHEVLDSRIAYEKVVLNAMAIGAISPLWLTGINPARTTHSKNERILNDSFDLFGRQAPPELIDETMCGISNGAIHSYALVLSLLRDNSQIESLMRSHYMVWYALEELRETGGGEIDVICGAIHVAEIIETLRFLETIGVDTITDEVKGRVASHRANKKYAAKIHNNTRYRIVQVLGFAIGASLWLPLAYYAGNALGDTFSPRRPAEVQSIFKTSHR